MSVFTLYRFYDAEDVLLYVGLSINPGKRFEKHRYDKSWWSDVSRIAMEHHPDLPTLRAAERRAIEAEKPKHNIRMNGGTLRDRWQVGQDQLMRHKLPSDTANDSGPWTFYDRNGRLVSDACLTLYWEINGDPITDDYTPDEADAWDLFRWWRRSHEPTDGVARIWWYVDVTGPNRGTFEIAPFADRHGTDWDENFLTFFSWPRHQTTGHDLCWASLPVKDKLWNENCADKGGFFQELFGWKPSAYQSHVDINRLCRTARV